MGRRRTLEQFATDFWARVEKSGSCWLWTGAKSRGYGLVSLDGRQRLTHRVSFFLHHRRWPGEGLFVLHECDTPACVNPAHLREGSALYNTWDACDRRKAGGAPGARTPGYLASRARWGSKAVKSA